MNTEDDSDSKPLLCNRGDASRTTEGSDGINNENEADEGETRMPCYGSFDSLPGEVNSFGERKTPNLLTDNVLNTTPSSPPCLQEEDERRESSVESYVRPHLGSSSSGQDYDHEDEENSIAGRSSSSFRGSTPSYLGDEMQVPVRSISVPTYCEEDLNYLSDEGGSINAFFSDSQQSPARCLSMPEGLVSETEENDQLGRLPRVTITSPGSTSSSETWESFSFWNSTREQKQILACMGLVDLTSYLCLSILAPFFPKEAAAKGVNDTVSGWIFGVFALVQFLTSPIFGKLLPIMGSRFLFISGQFFAGGCVILFGVLDFVDTDHDDGLMFIILCFVLRVFLAIGCTASATASFAITANTFPDHVATVFGILETFAGLGLMLGPALGGVLYEVGGFVTPFVVLGSLTIISVPLNMYILPPQTDDYGKQTGSLKELLSVPAIVITALSVVVGGMIWAILDPTLEPHLSVFNLSSTVVGLIFLLMSAFYAVFSPIWGWVCDKVEDSSPLLILGFLFSSLGLLLVGPSPIFGLDPNFNELWLNIVSLIILGVSVSLAVVPTFDKIIDAAEKAGIEDNFSMYGVVAGLWGSMYALGDFIGPSLGGSLVDQMGFPWTMTLAALASGVMTILCTMLWLYESRFGPSMSCMKSLREQVVDKKEPHITPPSPITFPTERTALLGREVSARGRLTERRFLQRQRSRSVGVSTKTAMPRRQPALLIKPDLKVHERGVVSDGEVSYSMPSPRERRARYVVP